MIVQGSAMRLAPVDTGTLKGSINWETNEVEGDNIVGIVGSNVEYALYQELGTSRMSAQPYLMPALHINKDAIQALFNRSLDN